MILKRFKNQWFHGNALDLSQQVLNYAIVKIRAIVALSVCHRSDIGSRSGR